MSDFRFVIKGEVETSIPEIRLNRASGDLELVARLEGTDWYILTLRKDGTLCLHTSIPEEIGLELDERGRLKTR